MLARGLVYCSLPGEISGYKRFRSVESKDCCPNFDPEPDTERIERRYETVRTSAPLRSMAQRTSIKGQEMTLKKD